MDWIPELITTFSKTTYLTIALLLVIITYLWPGWKSHYYPAGPVPLPVIGHIHYFIMNKNPYEFMLKDLCSKFSHMMTIWQGSTALVFLHSYEAIQEAFVRNADVISQRPPGVSMELNGCKLAMEEQIADECSYFLEEVDKTVDKPFDPKDQLLQAISNVITRVVFGSRFEYSSEQLDNVQFEQFLSVFMITNHMPFIRHLPGDPLGLGFKEKQKRYREGKTFASAQIQSHIQTLDVENPRDFIDSFLIEMKKHDDDQDTPFNVEDLLSTVMQLYIAGSDTTSTSLNWSFLTMLLNPDVQRRVQLEIDSTIGDKPVQYSDRSAMPYTQAVISEVLRISIAPQTIPHYATEDVVICGQNIPKGTIVVASLWAMHQNERIYPDPLKFNPEHFLDANGEYAKPDKTFMPFSVGRRVCPGESLARAELFVFFVSTLQKFDICKVSGEKYSMEGVARFTYIPMPYKLMFKRRK